MEQIIRISEFIFKSFLHIWPYLLVTIPLAVIINISGASKYISKAFGKKPLMSVLLATVVGAFSPFCSCGVIPVISSLLISGIPVAPVMSFWIASPSMDPEIFFLSSSVLGWDLAIWRLASTFVISLLGGYITHIATVRGYISQNVLKTGKRDENQVTVRLLLKSIRSFIIKGDARVELISVSSSADQICCVVSAEPGKVCSCTPSYNEGIECDCGSKDKNYKRSQLKRIYGEVFKTTLMVTKFMGIAFLINALIKFYLPADLINVIVSANPAMQVMMATLFGIPMYASNITALPAVGGLMELGLNKGAALSFLIGGAITTLPAMAAVWGITTRRVFLLYLSFAVFGALLTGLCFNLFNT
jgi:uncharacterized membrane protein YraQ (UPF0718 family)